MWLSATIYLTRDALHSNIAPQSCVHRYVFYLLVEFILIVQVYQAHEAQDPTYAGDLARLIGRRVQGSSSQSRYTGEGCI